MFQTIRYKNGFIHYSSNYLGETIRVMVDEWAYSIEVKSTHAAKLLITKHEKRYSK